MTKKYLKKTDDGITTCVAEGDCDDSENAFYRVEDPTNGYKCVSCADGVGITDVTDKAWKGVAGCAKCTKPESAGAATCTECASDYLKTDADATSCVQKDRCTGTHFPNDNAGGKKQCLSCSDKANGGIEHCGECALLGQATRATTLLVKCSKCTTGNLSPLGDECMAACPAGMYGDSNVCKPCHSSCAGCSTNAEASCTACYPGYVLSQSSDDTGTCIKECTGDFMAHCKADGCSLNVGGSKYCDQCEEGYAPVDGVCTSIPATARDASGCKASGGKCTICAGNYALISGGCYDTQKLPGMSICTSANTGQCTMCVASGTNPQGKPCPTCPAGCAKCAGDAGSQACSSCLSGYYLSTDKCFGCDAGNGGNIQGVPNCVSCKAPSSPSVPTPVTCYVKTDGTNNGDNDNSGGSTNKSGLSTGAIAGISVAVVVVVGGLVGFLCWWFICRGKA